MLSIRASQLAATLALATLLVVAPAGVCAEDARRAPPYALTTWTADSGLLSGDVFAIAQDHDGYLWLGTSTSLIRFDGFRFRPWTTPDPDDPPLPAAPIHAIVAGDDGSLWVGYGGGGGVVRIYGGRVTRYTADSGAPPGTFAMVEDREGTVWAAGRTGLFRFANDRWTRMGAASGYTGGEAFSVYEDRAGTLWVGTANGVYRRTENGFDLVDATATGVQAIVEDPSGAIWVTHPERILAALASRHSPAPSPSVRLPADAYRLLGDRHGQIWITAFGGGLLRVDAASADATIEQVDHEHRLTGSPRALYEDRDGNIWVGMRGGLMRFSEAAFVDAGLLGLAYDGVRTALAGRDGSVWVATAHTLNRFLNGTHQAYDVPQTLALYNDRRGALWMATRGAVGRLIDNRFVPVALPYDVASSLVMGMTFDPRGTLWLCSSVKGVLTWNNREMRDPVSAEERARVSGSCNTVYTDRRGRVWIGFKSEGAAVHEDGTFSTIGAADGLREGTVLAILQDSRGAVWLSTPNGLYRRQYGRLVAITQANAPLTDLVPVLLEDDEGFLWVGVNAGAAILRFHPSEADQVAANPNHQVQYRYFDESDGMHRGSQAWQAGIGGARDPEGRLWVATGLGMTIIDPRNLPRPSRPAPPRIETVTVDGRPLTSVADVHFPAGTSTLQVSYTAVDVTSASKLRFRHMLEGVDHDWVYAEAPGDVSYANIPPGEYRFRLATTYDGQWTDGAPWSFVIAPPFYRTPAFVTLALLAIALTTAGAWWLRLRAVRQQYALVLAERTRVSREIHDTLLQGLAAIGVELETIATELGPEQRSAREALRHLRRQVGHSVREARDSILDLRRHPLSRRTLIESLSDLAATATSRGVPAELAVTGQVHRCSTDVEFQLSRIAQEAVNNAVRHGRPARIRIALAYTSDQVVLSVADDGCGFQSDAAAAAGHFGLLSMRERAERIRGGVVIRSAPGAGTMVEATVPLTSG